MFQAPYNTVSYFIPSFVTPKIREYFDINPSTGVLYLKKSLLLDSARDKTFGVSTDVVLCGIVVFGYCSEILSIYMSTCVNIVFFGVGATIIFSGIVL